MTHPAESSGEHWRVACLCADWCGVCRGYRAGFEAAARRHPDVEFLWVDVEDESDVMGDVDIETFPTLLIARGAEVRFFGSTLPSADQIDRLLGSLRASFVAVDPQATALLGRLSQRFPTPA